MPGYAVSTPHHLATTAASDILASGGNAADATIAANAVLGVVAPETCGIGGDMFALLWREGMNRPEVVNSSGRAGSGADAGALRAAGHTQMPHMGRHTVTVPGCVRGWHELADRHGSRPLGEVLARAVELARGGFEASPELAAALAARFETLAPQAASAGLYPGGRPPVAGARLLRPGLADTLKGIAEGGADAFYLGAAGSGIVEATEGTITTDDLAGFRAEWVEPLRVGVFGLDGWTVPPNSQGYLTLATLAVFESTGVDPADPAWHHLLIESYRAVAASRDSILSDPDFLAAEFASMTHPDHLRSLGAAIDWREAGVHAVPTPAPGGTAYLCAVDGQGMAVSFIQSNFSGIGSGLGAGASGFFLHNRGAGFNLTEGHPNEFAPGKRPLHTLSPTLWTSEHGLAALLGTRGGHQQPQILAQVAAATLGAGAEIQAAQESARWTIDEFGPGSPSHLLVESRISPDLAADLERRGHRLEMRRASEPGWGPVSMIRVGEGGVLSTHRDPRVSTTSVAVV